MPTFMVLSLLLLSLFFIGASAVLFVWVLDLM